ncbi:siderophore-interacting protein [Microbacterium sp. ZW T5_56]|uniref:siderophore-interacting protein n=1 Tax=Microbacterium sp. ZW T5_56 TaxID=3378081 RepID=UPI00385215A4
MTDVQPRFHREVTRYDLVSRSLTVSRVQRVAPDMIRVTLSGAELDGFASVGPADHVKVFFPDTDGVIHTRRPDAEPTGTVILRDFTPLPRDGELALDFYTHADPGPAAAWAQSVSVGDAARIAGPRGSRGVPADASRVILFADETALPAVTRWLELLPASVAVEVIAMIGNGDWVADYLGSTTASVHVVGRDAESALAALATLAPIDESTFVWAAGEATQLIPIRRHLRRELGLPKEQVIVDGYWRRGAADFDHHAPLDPTDPEE